MKLSKIIINKKYINFVQTLECGQIFSYKILGSHIEIYSGDKMLKVYEQEKNYILVCTDPEYWKNFLDLQTDYDKIKQQLLQFSILEKPIDFGFGIRILRQDLFETIISFVVSANNNIKRITNSLFQIRQKFGKKINNFYAFPTLNDLENATENDFKQMGLGYRSAQIVKLISQLKTQNFLEWGKLETNETRQNLINLSGIGPKVADCILLFGYGKTDVFPVDTWIEKVYNDHFPPCKNRVEIRKNLTQIFGENSGYAQQYLFNFKRNFWQKMSVFFIFFKILCYKISVLWFYYFNMTGVVRFNHYNRTYVQKF